MFELDIHNDWRDDMYALAKLDPWYAQCQELCAERESAFLAIRKRLTEEERDALDLYIAACEEAVFALIYPAYEVGKKHK